MDAGPERRPAAAYIRVSTEDQAELSPDSQLEEIRKYARAGGMELLEDCVFIDAGISGKKAERRPEFMRMISLAKSSGCPFSVILLWKYSRFARNQEESIFYKSVLRSKCGVEVISVTEPLVSGPFGSLIERIIEWMDEFYSIRLSQEVKRSMTVNAERGVYQTTPPLGYAMEKKKLVPVAGEAETVRGIFRDFTGGASVFAIAKRLNAAGIRTRRGNVFESRTVEYILRNPVYAGMVRWNPAGPTGRNFGDKNLIVAEGGHEPLIDRETWDRAQRRLDELKALWGSGTKSPGRLRSWAVGLVRCPDCGCALTYQPPHFFKCSGYIRAKCLHSQHIRADLLEEAIISRLELDARGGAEMRYTILDAERSGRDEAAALEAELKAISAKLGRIQEAYVNAVIGLDEFSRARHGLLASYERAKGELERARREACENRPLQERLRAALESLRCPDAGNERRREAARSVIESCTFDKSRNLLTVVYRLHV